MFKIDKVLNRISPIESKSFAELGFRERDHLQEWLANQPDAFGEDLLIIQKEFAGFEDTRERLDLLALDKDGNLVVIENKLDDSGRDVTWQALKYASYCSSLNKKQILKIYQDYLDRHITSEFVASESLCEFLGVLDLDEIVLNSGNTQRLILVAANYRKEVTSTALWLLSHGIQVQCFRVTPYAMNLDNVSNKDLFLNVEQIVPPLEVEELMISMSEKNNEEKSTRKEIKNRHIVRSEFWAQALPEIKKSNFNFFDNQSITNNARIRGKAYHAGVYYGVTFLQKQIRIEVILKHSNEEVNKKLFDALITEKDTIEDVYGSSLEWHRKDDQKASRIQDNYDFDGLDKDKWSEVIQMIIVKLELFERAVAPCFEKLKVSM